MQTLEDIEKQMTFENTKTILICYKQLSAPSEYPRIEAFYGGL